MECEYQSCDVIRVPVWLFAVVKIYRVVITGQAIRSSLDSMNAIRCLYPAACDECNLWRRYPGLRVLSAQGDPQWVIQ
jgi:hypothetical protein